MTWEEVNWDHISPAAREVHNRVRQMKGYPPIPPPAVDLYKPKPPQIRPIDIRDGEALAAVRQFLGTPPMGMPRGAEGFTINGEDVDNLSPAKVAAQRERQAYLERLKR